MRATEREAQRVETLLARDPDVARFVTYVGNGSPRFFLSLEQQLFRANFAQIVVLDQGLSTARARAREAAPSARRAISPACAAGVIRVPLGPPVNYPIQFRVLGEDPAAAEADRRPGGSRRVRAQPATVDVNVDWGDKVLAMRVRRRPGQRARARRDLAGRLRARSRRGQRRAPSASTARPTA